MLIALAIFGAIFGYKRYRDNRYKNDELVLVQFYFNVRNFRNQEFLLPVSGFRNDGYSQIDDA